MPDPVVYLNGRYVPREQACLSVEDRGTLFGDGVYEVVRYYAGVPLAMDQHQARLRRSLAGIRLPEPAAVAELQTLSDELIRRNGTADAKVYWQITRGPAPRDHAPPAEPTPSVLAIGYPLTPLDPEAPVPRRTAILAEDNRWADCWIKSLMLLPNVLARQRAIEAGAEEAILHRGSTVTEATAANVLAVVGGELRTHPADRGILAGVTRRLLLDLAERDGIPVRERAVSTDQLQDAEEVLLTGTTLHVAAVTQLDGRIVGDGEPGPVTTRLHRTFAQEVVRRCGLSA